TAFAEGGKGASAIAKAVVESIEAGTNKFTPLYKLTDSIEHKIHTIATELYGADGVEYTSKARTQLKQIDKLGFGGFPVCMVKTPVSLSDDEKKIGRPRGFKITVREFEYSAGAG
ncbi:MAG TPA: formate--tetrahydrofolate ligase, partial [Saprospiraceae bacterium]|nr:formate--tetrahydrofolate ligase [Saprospiraceae bacterium]